MVEDKDVSHRGGRSRLANDGVAATLRVQPQQGSLWHTADASPSASMALKTILLAWCRECLCRRTGCQCGQSGKQRARCGHRDGQSQLRRVKGPSSRRGLAKEHRPTIHLHHRQPVRRRTNLQTCSGYRDVLDLERAVPRLGGGRRCAAKG